MKLLARLVRGAPVVLLCLSLNGCVPSGQSELEEEREPHFLEGKSCAASMDYKGAIEKFEQTLESNPHHAGAHFQLGCLYEEEQPDPAAAIYHYEQYLKLRPNAGNAEFIRQRILNCKKDLAKAVLLPIAPAPALQRQFEQLADENRRLRDEVEQWKAHFDSRAAAPPDSSASGPAPSAIQLTSAARTSPAAQWASPPDQAGPIPGYGTQAGFTVVRTHVVQSGENPYAIARRYGVKLEALLAANPGLEPRRMRVGQVLNIPAP